MSKELTHRGHELKELGWSEQDIFRYIELWDYRQRWGAINLERDDRLFLRKAESALPKIQTQKVSVKKPLKEKNYYTRILFFLDTMNTMEKELDVPKGTKGLWTILLEEELRLLDYFQPVLGLPDTLKAKAFNPFREQFISSALESYKKDTEMREFDFNVLTSSLEEKSNKKCLPLREDKYINEKSYPLIKKDKVEILRKQVREQFAPLVRTTLPSLSESDKPNPPEDWIPESNS
ncbi:MULTISPECIES: hypothetical protein [Prochlorococcus]|uniref:hypothetical protein n=1 Tax=Prochlorococcus TaxID=1218 RepID=UPI000533B35A|nr:MULTISPECIES: hypothetical protein [Prochlorococcus]KGG12589.1 hypothetical protein EV05_1801 [Prochlorococcus sp. MIT 0601]